MSPYPEERWNWPGVAPPEADFTVELLERDALGQHLTHVPDCVFEEPDPYGVVLEHARHMRLVLHRLPRCAEGAIRVFEKVVALAPQGWTCAELRVEGERALTACGCSHHANVLYHARLGALGPPRCPRCSRHPLKAPGAVYS